MRGRRRRPQPRIIRIANRSAFLRERGESLRRPRMSPTDRAEMPTDSSHFA